MLFLVHPSVGWGERGRQSGRKCVMEVDICAQSASEEKDTEADTFHQSPPKAAYVQEAELLS